jgi:ABC-type branched-subunit amino acid transport system substrate-binding protein
VKGACTRGGARFIAPGFQVYAGKQYHPADPQVAGCDTLAFRRWHPMQLQRLLGLLVAASAAVSGTLVVPSKVDLQTVTGGPTEPPFLVDVVANGIPADGEPSALGPDQENEAPGLDLWIGARTAYTELKQRLQDRRGPNSLLFTLAHDDDNDDPDQAQKIAGRLQSNPRTLAVIGHGITSTSSAAGPIYSRAGIPLIVALATGQSAVQDMSHGGAHLPICYRLPPSDGTVQAPAIAYMVRRLSPGTGRVAVHIYEGMLDNAPAYSKPLCTEVSGILNANGIRAHLTSLDSIPAAVQHIHREHKSGDVIVYCGYQKEASAFLNGLQEAYKETPNATPSIIFSDASPQILGADSRNFRVYKTEALDTNRCTDTTALAGLSSAAARVGRKLTAEQIHGYDAVMVLEAAVSKCFGSLSRGCVLDALGSGETFPSICSDYSFRNGENIISDYYIFSSPSSPRPQGVEAASEDPVGVVTLTAPDILHMLLRTEPPPQPTR